MAATNADTGYNSTFGIEDSVTPGTYNVVAEVTAIGMPGRTRDIQDATHLKSDDEYREYIAGLKEGGEVSLTLNYTDSTAADIVTAFEAGKSNFQITLPSGKTIDISGIMTEYQPGELNEGKIESTVTIKQSGKATVTEAA